MNYADDGITPSFDPPEPYWPTDEEEARQAGIAEDAAYRDPRELLPDPPLPDWPVWSNPTHNR